MSHHEIHLGMTLPAAFVLGALHVLEPAHGRSLVTAIAVGAGTSTRGVLLYGAVVTGAHSLSTLAMAGIATWLGGFISPGSVADAVRFLGSLVTIYIAYRMLRHAALREECGCSLHRHEEATPVGLGLAGGLVPCYGSLALVVAAIANGQVAATVPLVLAFALGLGVTLVVSALLARGASQRIRRRRTNPLEYSGYFAGGLVMAAGLIGIAWSVLGWLSGG